jgi:hypothetical protein
MTDILVDPADRSRGFVVVAYVARGLARQILYRSEDASRNNVALNLGKPNFDLVEPARVGRGCSGSEQWGWPQGSQKLSCSCVHSDYRQ